MSIRCTIAILLAALSLALPAAAEPLRYNRDIRPILAENCFACHGPDENTLKAGLRLDVKESALASGAIAQGKPQESELLQRIHATDANEVMPPPETKLSLTDAQKETLSRWISEGAVYEDHWAFISPEAQPRPTAESLPLTGIDQFVQARLRREGITPAPEAPRHTLLRRVSLDLTGLPPGEAELAAFEEDTAPNAYERAVDRLLNSPAYGEQMALDWLDVARYADTYGYQADRVNHLWPWRDWVIRAFNDNLPYDLFVLYQIAGDLLPNPTQDQLLATAFNRLHRQTNEGGSILEEMRTEYVADRVKTFGAAFLGMTFECARCHDHKFDPVSQREYYELFSFFNNIDESGMYSHFTDPIPSPAVALYEGSQKAEHDALKHRVAEAERALGRAKENAEARLEAWIKEENRELPSLKPVVHLPLDSERDGKTRDFAGDGQANLQSAPQFIESPHGRALEFNGDNGLELPGAGNFERTDAFSLAMWVKIAERHPRAVIAHHSKAREDAASRGWTLGIEDGKLEFSLVHFWPGNAICLRSTDDAPVGEWAHILVAYDGSSRADGLRLYLNGQPLTANVVRDNLYRTIRYASDGPAGLALASRFRDSGLKGGAIDEVKVFDRTLTSIEAQAIASGTELTSLVAEQSTKFGVVALQELYAAVDPEVLGAQAALREARNNESTFVEGIREIMVMREMPQPRQAYILARGAYDAPTDPVSSDVPEAIFPMDPALPRNRLGLAQWLLDPQHPLTARVAVNRYWQLFFGRGLVETQEDFGTTGREPSHPELLDWLARWFIDSGWNVKELHRLIITSATYRQDSRPRPELRERDPANVLLARGPRHRLSAEQLRDGALFAGGLLNPQIGGPSVKPYQPAGLWEDSASATYEQDHGPALYRRGMYTFIKRTVPHPALLTFDATSREVCTARRELTQTPLQALVLLNDPQFVEAARVLAGALVPAQPDVAQRMTHIFRRLTGRAPDATEQQILRQAYEEQRAHFAAHPENAGAYLQTGEAPAPEGDTVDIAATAAVVQAVMNFDEFQMKS